MGWARGSELMNKVISTVKHHVPDDGARKAVYKDCIRAFADHDWDTEYESMGQDEAFDDAMREVRRG